jgi:glycosyltransferase involved in cell wall biosynthesis
MALSKRLRIGILCGPLHPKYGGPAAVVAAHVEVLSPFADITLVGVVDSCDRDEMIDRFPDALLFDRSFPKAWYHGRGLDAALAKIVPDLDLIHAHMLWDHPVYAAWQHSQRANVPFIITPHGTLSQNWRWNKIHKRIYRRLVSDKMLEGAAAVHVLCAAEAESIASLGLQVNSVVIPNGLPASRFQSHQDRSAADSAFPQLIGRRVILFLGRLWSEKGLDILPRAWARSSTGNDTALLVIAGPDYKGYQKTLLAEIQNAGVSHSTLVTGPIFGSLKDSMIAAADVLVLPSRSEGFSMALLEAASVGLPTIFSRECNFAALATAGGGWEIERTEDALATALRNVLILPKSHLNQIGEQARCWSASQFTIEMVGDKLLSLYEKVV